MWGLTHMRTSLLSTYMRRRSWVLSFAIAVGLAVVAFLIAHHVFENITLSSTGSILLLVSTIVVLIGKNLSKTTSNYSSKVDTGLRSPYHITLTKEIHFHKSAGGQVSIHQSIQDELKKLRQGRILFNPSKIMRVGKQEVVEARIAKTLSVELEADLKGRGDPIIEELKVGDVMKANLRGSSFQIKTLSSKAQVVPDDDFAHWTWKVTPVKRGPQSLKLLVSVQIKVQGASDTVRDLPVYERDIEVKINPVYSTKVFVGTNWKWISGTIAIPVIAWTANEAGLLEWLKEWMSSTKTQNPSP